MYKHVVSFTDLAGVDKKKTLYFNLTQAEVIKLQADSENGIQFDLEEAVRSKDVKQVLGFIEKIVAVSYGIKSADNERFDKSEQIMADFENSVYYSDFYMSLFENEGALAIEFVNGILPATLIKQAEAQMRGESTQAAKTEAEAEYKPDAKAVFEERRLEKVASDQDSVIVDVNTINTPQPISEADRARFEAWKAAGN